MTARPSAAVRLAVLGLLCVLPACSAPGYVLEQAVGQLKILAGRRPVAEVLARSDLPRAWRDKLELVQLARRFGQEQLGLRRTAAYTYFYDTHGQPVAYNLSAAPKDALRPKVWTFPIVGRVPYLGFFRRERGQRFEARLREEGLDTDFRPVAAYSSLGWFADPIFSSMLDEEPWQLVDLVLHEITHTTIFLRNQVAFNESLAVFVGQQGTLQLLSQLYGATSRPVRELLAAAARQQRFSALVADLYRRLERLYSGSLSRDEKLRRREEHFAWAQAEYRRIFTDPKRWGRFAKARLNNAVLLNYGRYNQGVLFHQRVFERVGRDLRRLVALYEQAQHFDAPVEYVARAVGLTGDLPQRM
ncbi:MAG: aminopeptidase [Deltaproteobacteria bacterium]|nr:aminopeptidase [Deltaproteobacteria bacterium]